MLGSPDHVVVPGFVNGHHHVGLTPFQLGSPDYALELWFASRMAARGVDPYLDTLYSAFEMLESGITTVQHLHGWRIGPAAQGDRGGRPRPQGLRRHRHARVVLVRAPRPESAGLRGRRGLRRALPGAGIRRAPRLPAAQAIPIEDHHGIFTDLWEKCGRNTRARARVQLAPANLHWCSDEALAALRDWSAKYQVGMHMHLVETAYQREYARRRTGRTAFRHLVDRGLAGPGLTLGHGVWLTEDDIDLVAQTGTMICHNASSNLRLRSGVAPLNHWAARGVKVAMGLDEAGINDDRDMLQEMRLVLRLHRVPGMDDVVPTCPQVLRMATEDGAATTPYAGQIGTLAPGKAADVVLLSWPQIAHPYLDPDTSVVDAVVHRAKTSGVALVMVAGEVVLRDGRFTRIDKAAALAELAASLRAPLTPEEEGRRRLSREVFPVVKRFYDGWLDEDARVPFYRPSSRQ